MKYNVYAKLFIFIVLALTNAQIAFSQGISKGGLKGRIIAADDKEGLPSANITVEGTKTGVAADLNGYYILKNIPSGKVKLTVSFIGYKTKVETVEIIPDQITEVNFVLDIEAVKSAEITITAQAQGQREAIRQQLNSSSIVNVVAPDRIRQNPDANTAEALGRLPGLSLIRNGGEGTGIVIRGMGPQYSKVTLNGVELPSTDAATRNTSVSGISQFLLQTVEVYKTITPDMDGNSVAGAINMKLSEAPDSAHYSVLVQSGYNNMNDYWGNYKIALNYSNRYLDNKLGLRFDGNAERVNRGTQTMSGGYSITSNTTSGLGHEQVLLTTAGLTDIKNIKNKQAGTLVLDYTFSPTDKIFFYNLLSRTGGSYLSVAKNYNLSGNNLGTSIYQDDDSENLMYSGSVRAEHNIKGIELDYGAAFSQTHNYSPERKSYDFFLNPVFDAKDLTNESRMRWPEQVISSSYDNASESSLGQTLLTYMGSSSDVLMHKDVIGYFDVKVPVKLSDLVSGFIKAGAKYKETTRDRTYKVGSLNLAANAIVSQTIASQFPWINRSYDQITANGLLGGTNSDFLDGSYNFGWYPNLGLLNNIWDWWNSYSKNMMAQGMDQVIKQMGSYNRIGFPADDYNSSFNNQNMTERYYGTYLMGELSYSDLLVLTLGCRYEKVTDDLTGHYVIQREYTQIYGFDVPSTPVNAKHDDDYWLPMTNIKIKAADWLQINLSYTNALTRPDYLALIPNTYINNSMSSTYKYISGNPNLKPELWTNYDVQFAFFTNQVGLLTVNAFYKDVKDKIWSRTYNRIKGDASLPGFRDNDIVAVTETVNHPDKGSVKGCELEWQTSFWYLPAPFKYFSLNLNYTILKSEIDYPTTRVYTTYDIGSNGKPTAVMHRVDSTITDQFMNQPDNIANLSLGFNYKGLNAWLSFQFTGKMLTGWSYQKDLIPYKDHFYRWDLQVAQELPFKGLELLFNVANINNFQESSSLSGDSRPTYLERYGWTSDLGIRYSF
jgi:TonB-dependent receptor